MSTVLEKKQTIDGQLQSRMAVLSTWHKVAGTLNMSTNPVTIQKKIRREWSKREKRQLYLGSQTQRGN